MDSIDDSELIKLKIFLVTSTCIMSLILSGSLGQYFRNSSLVHVSELIYMIYSIFLPYKD